MINQNNLEKHNRLVEEINSDIDGLLNELPSSWMISVFFAADDDLLYIVLLYGVISANSCAFIAH